MNDPLSSNLVAALALYRLHLEETDQVQAAELVREGIVEIDRLTARVAELEIAGLEAQGAVEHEQIQNNRLRAALKAVQELGGKTLLGGEGHEPGFAHQLGANLAFCQAAEIASSALAGATDETTPAPELAVTKVCSCTVISEPKAIGLQTDPNCPLHGFLLDQSEPL